MENLNIERGLSMVESKLHDRKCLPELLSLMKEYPQSINQFINLAELIEEDLRSKRSVILM
jgi:hypothetical protein